MINARTRGAFTLVELLVVMGIIIMLMALLLPAIQGARETARQGACGNNIRELSMGVVTHATKKDRFPGWKATVGGQAVGWVPQIFPYIDQQRKWEQVKANNNAYKEAMQFLWCPSDPPSNLNSDPLQAPYPLSYACNGGASGENNGDMYRDRTAANPPQVSLEDISRAGGLSNRISITENTNLNEWTDVANEYEQAVLTNTVTHLGDPAQRGKAPAANLAVPSSYHKLGFNVGYADGHVEFFVVDRIAGEALPADAQELYLRRMNGS